MFMDDDQWMYDIIMSEEVNMDDQNEQECGVNEQHVDCSDAFNTSQMMFCSGLDPLLMKMDLWRSNTNTGSRGRTSFVLIGCERSGQYRSRKKDFVRRDTGVGNVGVPSSFVGNQWLEGKSLVGHPYVGRLTKDEKIIIADMTKSMVKSKNILLTLKEHNVNSCTTIKQIYNARSAYYSSIRGSDTEMQHLMKLLERDQCIHWYRLKDEDVVRDIFWCHPDAVKLCNTCNLVFLIDSTYKTNRYRLPLLDFVGVTPTGMTFDVGFAYLEGERANNVVWASEQFRGIFIRHDSLPRVIVTDRDLALMNVMKFVFLECTNLLCRFHINKNVKEKCESLIGQKMFGSRPWMPREVWLIVLWNSSSMNALRSLKLFIIPHKEKFVTAWTNKVMYLGNNKQVDELMEFNHCICLLFFVYFKCRVESAHWALKKDAMSDMITLQHTEIKASFETSTHVIGHVFKVALYKRVLGIVSRYALNQIAAEFERVHYAGKNPSSCGCHKNYAWSSLCIKLREIAYPDQNSMCPPPTKINTKGAPKKPINRNQISTKRDLSYLEYRSPSSSDQSNPRRIMPMLDQFQPFIHNFIDNIVDVKADGNCGYWSIVALLGMGEDSWSLVRNHLLKELVKFSNDYIKLFDGTDKFEELRRSRLVDGLSKMDITEMGYIIASRYNVILVSLSRQQSMTFFPLRSQLPTDSSVHCIICIGHVYDNHCVRVYLKDRCPLPPLALLWSRSCHPEAKQ
ncbi:Protein FAR1-RELATED SEQUENCE 5 [Glycine soja]